jgi:hypothetical protein
VVCEGTSAAVLLIPASVGHGQQHGEAQLSGTAINMTNPDHLNCGPVHIFVLHGDADCPFLPTHRVARMAI